MMDVSRSGYYKWVKRKGTLNKYETARAKLTQRLVQAHSQHKSYGYHRLAHCIRRETGWAFSDNLAHKCCKEAGILSAARQRRYRKPRGEHITYRNLVQGKWNASRPLELVVSDMTYIKNQGKLYEWTLLLDTFNNEIIAHSLTNKHGSNTPYYECLNVLNKEVGKKTEQTPPTILHTDQGAVYSSQAFAEAHKQYNIIRSMSRVGTPTDNPIMESINGWVKDELYIDFGLEQCNDLPELLDRFVSYFNNTRPAFALGYKSPVLFKTEQGF